VILRPISFVNRKDGFVTNTVTGNDINNRDRFNLRGDFLFNPSDELEIRVIADFDNISEECCATVNLVPGPTLAAIQAAGGDLITSDPDARTQLTNIDPTNEQDNYGVSAQVDYDFGNDVALTSITSYRRIDTFADIDADFTSADLITNDITTDIETFTQEFRLTGTTGSLDWQLGAFYFKEDIETENNLVFGGGFRPFVDALVAGGGAITGAEVGAQMAIDGLLEAGLDPTSPAFAETIQGAAEAGAIQGAQTAVADFAGLENVPGEFFADGAGVSELGTLDNEALSIFGQFDYHINDRLTASLGVNFTFDDKEATIIQPLSDVFSSVNLDDEVPDPDTAEALSDLQFLPPLVDLTSADPDSETEDSELTYNLRLAYDLTDRLNLYGSFTTGFKASSFNLTRDSQPGFRFADPEEATVFELGLKGTFARGSILPS